MSDALSEASDLSADHSQDVIDPG
uniref:Uncharacterized protein n=1 Tax=Anguilla anguilla TaxID=7936 RepID=A0A0E9SPW1_ANGAN